MRYSILTLLLSLSLSAVATDELIVCETSNETKWAITTIKELSFDGKGVKIMFNDETSVYYSNETLNMLKFNVTSSSGLNDLNERQNGISLNGNIINTTKDTDIYVYSFSGRLLAHKKGSSLDISNLPNGAYIIKAGNSISKILKP